MGASLIEQELERVDRTDTVLVVQVVAGGVGEQNVGLRVDLDGIARALVSPYLFAAVGGDAFAVPGDELAALELANPARTNSVARVLRSIGTQFVIPRVVAAAWPVVGVR
jgi:hypothetical protein